MATAPQSEERNSSRSAQLAAQEAAQGATQTAREGTREATRAARDASQTTLDATRRMAEQTSRAAEAAGKINERAVLAGAEMLKRQAETAQQALQAGAKMVARMTERSADQISRAMGLAGKEAQATLQSNGNIDSIVQSTTVMAGVPQRILVEWIDFTHQRMERNFDRLEHLFQCRTPQDYAALHSEMMRDNLEAFLGLSRRIGEQSLQMADEAGKRISENLERARQAA